MNVKSFWTFLGDSFAFFTKVLEAIRKTPILSLVWGFEVLIFVFTVIIFILGGLSVNGRLIVAILNVVIIAGVLVFTIKIMPNGNHPSSRGPDKQSTLTLHVVVHREKDKTSLIPGAKVTLSLPDPQIKVTGERGEATFASIPSKYSGIKFDIKAVHPDFLESKTGKCKIEHDACIYLSLIPGPPKKEEDRNKVIEEDQNKVDLEVRHRLATIKRSLGNAPGSIVANLYGGSLAAFLDIKWRDYSLHDLIVIGWSEEVLASVQPHLDVLESSYGEDCHSEEIVARARNSCDALLMELAITKAWRRYD
jgi:hypothetical protein